MEQTNIILEQYKTSVEAYEDKFPGIDNFAQKYGLTDFKYGLNRLKQGVVQVSNTAGTFSTVWNLTQKFNDLSNVLYLRGGMTTEMLVSEIYPFLNELINGLYQSKNIINLECDEIQKLFTWMNIIKSKKAADKISLEDEKQISLDIQIAYDKVNKSLK